jgi:hypothetical protein
VDHYPSKSLDLVAALNLEFEISSTGNTLEFGASALHPDAYLVWRNSSLYESGGWTGGNITINVDGISAGYHDFWMVIYHVSGHTTTTHSYVTVTDLTPPEWSSAPTDEQIEYGEAFYQNYIASDPSGIDSWWVNSTDFSISGTGVMINNTVLDIGEYSLRISCNDTFGNVLYEDIVITVSEPVITTTATTPEPTSSTTPVGSTSSTTSETITTDTITSTETTTASTTTPTPSPTDPTTIILIVVVGGIIIVIVIVIVRRK